VLLSEEAIVVDDLGDSSGSDDDLGPEAKRILRKRKLEKQKLAKLGKLIPIETELDQDTISIAESISNAQPLPLRTKVAESNLTMADQSLPGSTTASNLLLVSSKASIPTSNSMLVDTVSRISKSVDFGIIEEKQFKQLVGEMSAEFIVPEDTNQSQLPNSSSTSSTKNSRSHEKKT